MGLVIAGFHRSGTSSVMQHLVASGLKAGNDLLGANEFNPYGYFEDWPPVRFHDAVLESSGLDWAAITRDQVPLRDEDRDFIRTYCAERENQTPVWGVKDPRICQFLTHWMELDPNLKAVIVYRSPAQCAWSLYRRAVKEIAHDPEGQVIRQRILNTPDHALSLWITHNRQLVDVVRRMPGRCLVLGHDSFAAGFNLANEVRHRFGVDLKPVEVKRTFDNKVVQRNVDPLPVQNAELAEEATELWNTLRLLDVDGAFVPGSTSQLFEADPSGLRLANSLLRAANSLLDADNSLLRADNSRLSAEVDERRVQMASSRTKIEAAGAIARRLHRWPFSVYFQRHRKYSWLLKEVAN